MTVQPGEYYTAEGYIEDEPQVYEGGAAKIQPVPVYSLTEDNAPEYGACMTWPIPQAGVGQPVQVLTRRTRRHKAKLMLITNPVSPVTDTQVANPAAGSANFVIYTVPTGDTVQLQSVRFTYVTDATVGNRAITIRINDGAGNIVAEFPALTAQPASTTCVVNAFVGSTGTPPASGTANIPLPNMLLQSGWVVRVIVSGTVGAADQASAITVTVNTEDTGTTVFFNAVIDRLQGSNPQGFAWALNGPLPDWESQQPLYAIAVGGTATVAVWDESYAER